MLRSISAKPEGTACRHYHGILAEASLLLHAAAEYGKLLVTVHHAALLVHCDAAVRVAVKGKSAAAAVSHHCLHEAVYIGASAALVDIGAVGAAGHDYDLGSQLGEYLPCGIGRTAVGAVKDYLHAAQVGGYKGSHPCDIFRHGSLTMYYTPHLIVGPELHLLGSRQHKALYLVLSLLGQLAALRGKQLQTVVLGAVVASRYHYASVGSSRPYEIGYGRSRHSSEELRVGAHGAYSRAYRRLESVRGQPCVLADEYLCFFAALLRKHQCSGSSRLHGELAGEVGHRNTSRTVGPEKFSHRQSP